jgi:hypothetical protein
MISIHNNSVPECRDTDPGEGPVAGCCEHDIQIPYNAGNFWTESLLASEHGVIDLEYDTVHIFRNESKKIKIPFKKILGGG